MYWESITNLGLHREGMLEISSRARDSTERRHFASFNRHQQMEEIRLLSLWQPWASFIPHGLKDYETRLWATNYRGKIAIHAAQRKAQNDEVVSIYDNLKALGGTNEAVSKLDRVLGCFLMWKDDLPYGAITAIVSLVNCLEMWDSQVYGPLMPLHRRGIDIASVSALEKAVGNWQEGRFAWEQANIRPLAKPIPCKGAQGLRTIRDEAILMAIEQQLAYTADIERQLQVMGEVG